MEFAAGLPTGFKVKGLTRKYLLRQVARDWLPEEVLNRPKQGFPMPMGRWFRRDARELARDLLSPAVMQQRGIFSPAAVARMLDQHESEVADHGAELWALVSIELWQRLFLDGRAGARC